MIFGPAVDRTATEQQIVDEACRELTLYYFLTCPFCIRVMWVLRRMALNIKGCNIRRDAAALSTLLSEGGKAQVPCLRIARQGEPVRWLYESTDIIDYLQERFPTSKRK